VQVLDDLLVVGENLLRICHGEDASGSAAGFLLLTIY
jgi:hypothetical protein